MTLSYGRVAGEQDGATSVPEFPAARAGGRRASGRLRAAGRGRHRQGSIRQADQVGGRRRDRLRRAHADAGPDRQPRPRDPERSEHPLPRSRAADPDDGARRAADARACSTAASPRCATPAAPTGASRPRVEQADIPGPRLFIAGAAIGPTGGHSDPRRRTDFGMRCHCCDAMRFGMRAVGRRVRGDEIRARADAPGRRPHQDHDVGRRRLALRSARQPAVSAGRGRGRRAGGARLRPLCLRPRLYAGSDARAPRMAACA